MSGIEVESVAAPVVTNTNRYTYDRRSHFKECINQFQARQNQNISHIEAKLMEDFITVVEKYDEKYKNSPDYKRKNLVNIQCILYQLLLKNGYNCKQSDFFPYNDMIDKKFTGEDFIHELFKELNWDFQSM